MELHPLVRQVHESRFGVENTVQNPSPLNSQPRSSLSSVTEWLLDFDPIFGTGRRMRFFIATLLVCLGPVVAHGQKSSGNTALPVTRGPKQASGFSPQGIGGLKSASPRIVEGQNFNDSSIGSKGPFVWIKPGTFQMGSTQEMDPDRFPDETQHPVTLTRGFWLLDHEVTLKEYARVMLGREGGDDRPIGSITWFEANEFCKKLTQMDRDRNLIREDQEYRLPTEAEWEYAARAGTTGARHGELDAIAWWNRNSVGGTHPVKQKQANAWGLHDMIGNVWEWCGDWYGAYPPGGVTNPAGPSSGRHRVARGGSWGFNERYTRSAKRYGVEPQFSINYGLGFRPALSSVR